MVKFILIGIFLIGRLEGKLGASAHKSRKSKVLKVGSRNFLVRGNFRNTEESVLLISGLVEIDEINDNEINEAVKKIFASGFFSDVKILYDDEEIVVEVVERKKIKKIVIKGSLGGDTEDYGTDKEGKKDYSLKAGGFLDESILEEDRDSLLRSHNQMGFSHAKVRTKVIDLPNNLCVVEFEVIKGLQDSISVLQMEGAGEYYTRLINNLPLSEANITHLMGYGSSIPSPQFISGQRHFIEYFLKEKGFLESRILSQDCMVLPGLGTSYLNINIYLGPRYHVREILIKSIPQEIENLDLRGLFACKNKSFQKEKIAFIQKNIAENLEENGIFHLVPVIKEVVNKKDKTVDLVFTLKNFSYPTVRNIVVLGNFAISRELIDRHMTFEIGGALTEKKLTDFKKDLLGTGLVKDVEIKTDLDRETNQVDLIINIVESTDRDQINFGASKESYHRTFLINFSLANPNFLGLGHNLSCDLSLSDVYNRIVIAFGIALKKKSSLTFDINLSDFRQDMNDSMLDLDKKLDQKEENFLKNTRESYYSLGTHAKIKVLSDLGVFENLFFILGFSLNHKFFLKTNEEGDYVNYEIFKRDNGKKFDFFKISPGVALSSRIFNSVLEINFSPVLNVFFGNNLERTTLRFDTNLMFTKNFGKFNFLLRSSFNSFLAGNPLYQDRLYLGGTSVAYDSKCLGVHTYSASPFIFKKIAQKNDKESFKRIPLGGTSRFSFWAEVSAPLKIDIDFLKPNLVFVISGGKVWTSDIKENNITKIAGGSDFFIVNPNILFLHVGCGLKFNVPIFGKISLLFSLPIRTFEPRFFQNHEKLSDFVETNFQFSFDR